MGILSKLFGKEKPCSPEHAVIVKFNYGQPDLNPLFALEEELEKAVDQARAGEYDGNEVATDLSDGSLYLYGPSADALFKAVRPILERTPFMAGAVVVLRYGPPEDGVKETRITLG